MIRYDPTVPRVGFGIAALLMSALTVSLMVVLPVELEQDSPDLVVRAAPDRTAAAARAAGALPLRCTVPAAVNAPLFVAARPAEPDTQCKEQS